MSAMSAMQQPEESHQSSQHAMLNPKQAQNPSRLNAIIQKNFDKKQQLGASFSGVVRSGIFKDSCTLSVFYALRAGPDWQLVNGQPSGISQKSASDDDRIVWDFPFAAAYQTMSISDWPQILLVLYRTDYFGRSLVQAYGNTHLPMCDGKIMKKIKVYKPCQPSSIWSWLNKISANFHEFKEPEKHLLFGSQRSSMKVAYCGEIQMEVELKRINFQKNGYQ